ncbi:glycosyltransferase family 9 protein [Kiritimatiella glycovorans]|uniref:Glycosyltransferase family 9 (Heptosyltransferase) n=1 Tax=Kiritimatiella glycovorans TaxID=1307763 RepID=A0A0G3EGB9_9BACT|nr:glycosyltransferase family 9 protein [Kiritimatiella glycovorans]AKJ64452.1 hypothetical protein L21SP4_01204 [Kiritimatiella glycovorans]
MSSSAPPGPGARKSHGSPGRPFRWVRNLRRRRPRLEIRKGHTVHGEKILLAGPWIGEFGWELFCWQGMLRREARRYDQVIVASRPEMEPLYRDFCGEFVAYRPGGEGISGYRCEDGSSGADAVAVGREYTRHITGQSIIGYNQRRPYLSSRLFLDQTFVAYGRQDPGLAFDVLLHARSTKKNHSGDRNGWDAEGWARFAGRLRSKGLTVACVGTSAAALAVEGCDDYRGIPLDQLFNLMRSSRVLAGPSSGPIHLAALCRLPHVVWSGAGFNRAKYEYYWNPFRVPVRYIAAPLWRPGMDEIERNTMELADGSGVREVRCR